MNPWPDSAPFFVDRSYVARRRTSSMYARSNSSGLIHPSAEWMRALL